MYKNKKIVAVTPAGRKKYMELLAPYVLKNEMFDEWQIWQNTNEKSDIDYFETLFRNNHKVRVIKIPTEKPNCDTIYKYFEYCTQKDTIYVRFDDDVVWMEQDAAKKLVEYRLNNPQYFLVFGNTVNNALCDFLHKKNNILDINDEIEYECMGKITWNAPVVAEKKHRAFLANYENNKVTGYYFTDHLLKDYERCSINVISWFGEKFAEFNGIVGTSEEQWLACVKPFLDKTPNVIFGNAIFVHYAFGPQRQHLTKTNVLDCYRKINPFFQDTILHD